MRACASTSTSSRTPPRAGIPSCGPWSCWGAAGPRRDPDPGGAGASACPSGRTRTPSTTSTPSSTGRCSTCKRHDGRAWWAEPPFDDELWTELEPELDRLDAAQREWLVLRHVAELPESYASAVVGRSRTCRRRTDGERLREVARPVPVRSPTSSRWSLWRVRCATADDGGAWSGRWPSSVWPARSHSSWRSPTSEEPGAARELGPRPGGGHQSGDRPPLPGTPTASCTCATSSSTSPTCARRVHQRRRRLHRLPRAT